MKSKGLVYHGQPHCTKLGLVAGDRKNNEVRIKITLANRLRTKAFVLEYLC